LLFGFAGALRRSELVALQVEDVAIVAGGLRLRIVRGKPIRQGRGPRSTCRAAAMPRPARRGHSRRGRLSLSARLDRYFAESAPAVAAAPSVPAKIISYAVMLYQSHRRDHCSANGMNGRRRRRGRSKGTA
jgi:hypothetical protein